MVANTFLKLSRYTLNSHGCNDGVYSYFTRNICNRCIDSLKTPLEQRQKHVLQLYGDHFGLERVIHQVNSSYFLFSIYLFTVKEFLI